MRFALMLPLLFHRFALEDPNFVLYSTVQGATATLTALTVHSCSIETPVLVIVSLYTESWGLHKQLTTLNGSEHDHLILLRAALASWKQCSLTSTPSRHFLK